MDDQPGAFPAAAVDKFRVALAAAGVDAFAYSRDRPVIVPSAFVPACLPLHLLWKWRDKATAGVGAYVADLLEEVGGTFGRAAAGKCHILRHTASVAVDAAA